MPSRSLQPAATAEAAEPPAETLRRHGERQRIANQGQHPARGAEAERSEYQGRTTEHLQCRPQGRGFRRSEPGRLADIASIVGDGEHLTQAALAGAGLVVAGLLAIAALPAGRETAIAPIGLGLALGVVGATVELTGAAAADVLAVVVAVVLTASIGVPWLALASTPLRVVSPRSDAEILLDPAPVDPDAVRRQLDAGYRIQLALRVAVGVLALVATPTLVPSGLLGTTLLVVGWVGLLLSTRQSYARADVLVVVCLGITGLALTLVVAALVHPGWRTALVCAAAAAVAALVALGLVAPRRRVALARVGDTVEMTCLAVLLPLGVAAAGMV